MEKRIHISAFLRPDLRRYGIAMLSVATITVLIHAMRPWIGENFPPAVWVPSILLGAWYGGLGAGILTTVLNALAAAYLLPPIDSFRIADREGWIHIGVLGFYGVVISWLCESRRRAVVARTQASHDASRAHAELQATCYALARANANLRHVVNVLAADASQDCRQRQVLAQGLTAYSRIAQSPPRMIPVDSRRVIETASASFSEDLSQAGGQITFGDDLPVLAADESQLLELFRVLIDNAIKFRATEPPQISITASQRKGQWHFYVADNGIGIIPAHWDEVFALGRRLRSDEYPGAGAGLAIAKCVVENHGGLIWLTSEVGRGTTIRFTIPGQAV